jgi:hypothetical protein
MAYDFKDEAEVFGDAMKAARELLGKEASQYDIGDIIAAARGLMDARAVAESRPQKKPGSGARQPPVSPETGYELGNKAR